MAVKERRVALVCRDLGLDLVFGETKQLRTFNYSVRRILATIRADPGLAHVQAELVEHPGEDPLPFVEKIEALDPDVVGFSVYVWSFAIFVKVARELKRRRPDRLILFGGPSARPEMFALAPYREVAPFVDACVIREGERTVEQLLRLERLDRAALTTVPGLAVNTGDGFVLTPERPLLDDLDALASPYQMGIAPAGATGHFETFRGCPLTCRFCQWGAMGSSTRVFSTEYLVRELEAYRAMGLQGVFSIDAGLNLNSRAFRNLCEAERQVGFLKETYFRTEVYPSKLNDQHLEFLASVPAYVGIGLQSYDREVLAALDRSFDSNRFDRNATDVARVAKEASIEMIVGLPGDNPRAFRQSLERALRLPASVRVFHCLVLPDALLSRAPADAALKFDPVTLRITSCRGWSARDMAETLEWLGTVLNPTDGGGDTWTSLSPGELSEEKRRARELAKRQAEEAERLRHPHRDAAIALESCALARRMTTEVVEAALDSATAGAWRLRVMAADGERLLLTFTVPDGDLTVEAAPVTDERRSYKVVDGIGYSYRGTNDRMTPPLRASFDRVIEQLSGRLRGRGRTLPVV